MPVDKLMDDKKAPADDLDSKPTEKVEAEVASQVDTLSKPPEEVTEDNRLKNQTYFIYPEMSNFRLASIDSKEGLRVYETDIKDSADKGKGGRFTVKFRFDRDASDKTFILKWNGTGEVKIVKFDKFWKKEYHNLKFKFIKTYIKKHLEKFKEKSRKKYDAYVAKKKGVGESKGFWLIKHLEGEYVEGIYDGSRDGVSVRSIEHRNSAVWAHGASVITSFLRENRLYVKMFLSRDISGFENSDAAVMRFTGIKGLVPLSPGSSWFVGPKATLLYMKTSDTIINELTKEIKAWESAELDLPVPATPLFDYQTKAVKFVVSRSNALIATGTGTGKTVIGLTYALWLKKMGFIDKVIIFAPGTLMREWVSETMKFYGGGTTKKAKQYIYKHFAAAIGLGYERASAWRANKFIVLSTYDSLRSDLKIVKKFLVKNRTLIIADEAMAMKNVSAKRTQAMLELQSSFKLAMTATPIENRITELFTLERWLGTSMFTTEDAFRDRFSKRGYSLEFELKALKKQLEDGIMYRVLLHDIADIPDVSAEDVLIEYEGAVLEDYNQIAITIQGFADTFKELKWKLVAAKKYGNLSGAQLDELKLKLRNARMALLAALGISMQFTDHPKLLKYNSKSPVSKLVYPKFNKPNRSPKLLALVNLVKTIPDDDKFILYTRYPMMAEWIKSLLEEVLPKQKFLIMTGKTLPLPLRWEITDKFRTGKYRALIMSDVGTHGLNLQVANWVINYDLPWNPAKLEQRQGRVTRHGQTKPIHVVNLVVKNAEVVEQHIMSTLDKKVAIASRALDDKAFNQITEYLKKRSEKAKTWAQAAMYLK